MRDKTDALRRKGVGPAGWTPHWFRHSHATALLLAGTPEWVVTRRLGHAGKVLIGEHFQQRKWHLTALAIRW